MVIPQYWCATQRVQMDFARTWAKVLYSQGYYLYPGMTDNSVLADDTHYLRALTEMADRSSLVAGAAIYNDQGIKLVEKGARIDSRLFDRLVLHKLREPIDRHLSVEAAVDVPQLLAASQALIEHSALPKLLAQALDSGASLLMP